MTGKDGTSKTAEYGAVPSKGEADQQPANGGKQPSGPESEPEAQPEGRQPRDSSGDMIPVAVDAPLARAEDVQSGGADGKGKGESRAPAEEEPDPVGELQAKLDKKQNQLLRVAADFDNFKKRSRKDAQEAAFRAKNEVLTELLPVVDNLELALAHVGEDKRSADTKSLHEGVDMVLRQFHSVLERFEVKALDALGQPFDPTFHEALQQRETEDHAPGTIIEEFRRGYMMGDRLVRPAMVVVAKAPQSDGGDKPGTTGGGNAGANSTEDSAEPGQGEESRNRDTQ